ncbi:MAG TPA: 50S ribosomal protein L25 [Patescibacteria group bacterium]|nr:50S ribosomal protein L25 [Patescibacteria group bacterium]
MDKQVIKAEERTITGRKVKRLRAEGFLPSNIYGAGFKSLSIQVAVKDFAEAFKKAGETGVCEIELPKNKKIAVLIHNVQKDPVTESVLHVDFLKVDLTKKVTANIPLEIIGESPAEKQGLGTVVQYLDEIEVESLPQDLVDRIEINAELLDKEDSMIMIKDLDYDKKKLTIQNDPDQIIAKVEVQKVEVEAPVAVEVPAEGEAVEGEAKPTEGTPAEAKEETPEEKK